MKRAFTASAILAVCLMLWVALPVIAQTPEPTPAPTATPTPPPPTTATTYRQAYIFGGPGIAQSILTSVEPDTEVTVVERNAIGNWVRVQRIGDGGAILLDGWMLTGFLKTPPGFDVGYFPVTDLPDTDHNFIPSFAERRLYLTPVLTPLSDRMQEIYNRGQELGNEPFTATKIGDSVVANELYLLPMSRADFQLGPYQYLDETLKYFGPMMSNSVAARVGMSSIVVFDPFWANGQVCEPNETPLACEYRLKKPVASFVMFGPNDVRSMEVDRFTDQMTRLVIESLDLGVIPVLVTFASHPDVAFYDKTIQFNNALLDIADTYSVPVINLWLATRILPQYGLDVDGIHLRQPGSFGITFADGQEAYSGVALLNLLSLRTLHEIRQQLELE